MMNTCELGCQNRECPGSHGPQAGIDGAFADRMVNIAGIGRGDRVTCMGDVGRDVKAAISDMGAHILSASASAKKSQWNPSRWLGYARADVVLCAAGRARQAALVVSMSALRQNLRPSGRLVVWAIPNGCQNALAFSKRLQRLVGSAGFASVIVGQLSSNVGDVVVATGILNSHRNDVF